MDSREVARRAGTTLAFAERTMFAGGCPANWVEAPPPLGVRVEWTDASVEFVRSAWLRRGRTPRLGAIVVAPQPPAGGACPAVDPLPPALAASLCRGDEVVEKVGPWIRRGWVAAGVYLLHGAGRVKIGFCSTLSSRVAAIQSYCPVRLELVGFMPHGGRDDEAVFHAAAARARTHGEWFDLSEADLSVWGLNPSPWPRAVEVAGRLETVAEALEVERLRKRAEKAALAHGKRNKEYDRDVRFAERRLENLLTKWPCPRPERPALKGGST